jgi:Asp-tRNA(Asn)/Glu-tRNA(Gln) amidotransferase A subunit family amidase
LTATRKVAELQARVEAKLCASGVAALVTPTVPHTARPVADFPDVEADPLSVGGAVGRNVLPGSVWGLCGCSLPVQRFAASKSDSNVVDELPVGLQLLCGSGRERDVLQLALAIERL